jgi:hypothetical protein
LQAGETHIYKQKSTTAGIGGHLVCLVHETVVSKVDHGDVDDDCCLVWICSGRWS